MKVLLKFLIGVRKEYILALILTVLLVFALTGYLFEGHHVPIRVAFDTDGGDIIFDHKLHTDIEKLKCTECHHNYEERKTNLSSGALNCRSCHYSSEYEEICKDEPIHKHCIGKNCIECHISESVNCDFCHNAKKFKGAEQPVSVIFQTEGGKVVFNHKDHASSDGYDLGCDTCHHKYLPDNPSPYSMNCRQCHYNTAYSSLCENADTHTRCIGRQCIECHTEGLENCEFCHKEE